jgi:Zn-dependent membrane protease YugP
MFYIDPVYFWFVFIPVVVISLGVQLYMRSTYNKWSKIENTPNLNVAPNWSGTIQTYIAANHPD